MASDKPFIVGLLTISDRASQGIYEDKGGPAMLHWLEQACATPFETHHITIADEQPDIEQQLIALSQLGCDLILTTGGTGPAPRDITPEATEAVCNKILPGFGELMRHVSLQHVPTAILSRQTAGILNQSLIINLPGKPQAIAECLDAVFAAVPYCIDLIGGAYIETNPDTIQAFRPKA